MDAVYFVLAANATLPCEITEIGKTWACEHVSKNICKPKTNWDEQEHICSLHRRMYNL